MCSTCGCNKNDGGYKVFSPDGHHHHHGNGNHRHEHHHHHHGHSHEHDHEHDHHENEAQRIAVETNILHENTMIAQRNRGFLEGKESVAFNLMSSPGSGKTSLLERTLTDLKSDLNFYVIEGDQQTTNDAERIKATGTKAVQINTGDGCHLDARMIGDAFKELTVQNKSVVFIENVGNLVCPALFDLGENKKVVIISVTEGDDKPLKYPNMFHVADLCLINKTDLLPYVKFDTKRLIDNALKINHKLEFIELSTYSGDGLQVWYQWIRQQLVH